MKVLIVTEGSKNIGFGHVTRCLSLYQAFEERGIIPTFIINGDETVKDLLLDKNYKFLNWFQEKEKLYSFIKIADIVIIDSYLADYDFYKNISNIISIPVYIDDNKRLDYPMGVVVNGTIFVDELGYPRKEDITYLIGSQYILLQKEFWDVQDKEIKETVRNVMITFGGEDVKNMTPGILNLLKDNFPKINKKIIIGKGFKNTAQIEALRDERTEHIYYPDAEGMKKAMTESDIAISAGGQTLYELARIGVPTIAISVADNQINNVNRWEREGFVFNAGGWNNRDLLVNINKGIYALRKKKVREKMSNTGRKIVNGLGALRTIKCLVTSYFENVIIIRMADLIDLNALYELSNDLEVRQNSFNRERLEFENYKNWFIEKLNNPNCIFLVAELNNNIIGQVRFDINNDVAVISISIHKDYRRKGIGNITIKKAIGSLKLVLSHINFIRAYVKQENLPSIKFFNNSNFKFVNKLTIKDQDAVEYVYKLKNN